MIDYKTAKQYVDFGWSVIPVILSKKENGKVEKKPGPPSWKAYQERLPTDEELHEWFDQPRYNGIGLVTGQISGLVVVDVDSLETPIPIDAGFISKTISGGHHYFFKWTEEIRNGVRFLPNIDFRGDGGFVVIAPSALEGVGSYVWQKAKANEMTPLPENIKMSLDNQGKTDDFELVASDMFAPAEQGERDNRATQLAGWLVRKLPERDWEGGLEMLMLWNKNNPEPLSDHDILKCWNSVSSRERRKHESRANGENSCKVFYGQEALREDQRLRTEYGDGMTTGFDELDKMFKFLPQQLYLISAATHQGKTTFALNMCARIASLGARVMFCSLEQGTFIAPRVETMLTGPFPPTLAIMTADNMTTVKGLVDFVESLPEKPHLLCIDHLQFIKKKGNGVTQDIDEIIIEIQNMAKHLEIPIILIAHTRKMNDDRPPTLDDLRDSSSLAQVPAVVIFLHRQINKDMRKGGNYLSDSGILYVSKNRVQGVTGARSFTLQPSGAFQFHSLTPEQMEVIVKGFADQTPKGSENVYKDD